MRLKKIILCTLLTQYLFANHYDPHYLGDKVVGFDIHSTQESHENDTHDLNVNGYYGHILSSLSLSYVPKGKVGYVYQGMRYEGGVGGFGPYAALGPDLRFRKLHVYPFLSFAPLTRELMPKLEIGEYAMPEGIFFGGGVSYQISESLSVMASVGLPYPFGLGISKKI